MAPAPAINGHRSRWNVWNNTGTSSSRSQLSSPRGFLVFALPMAAITPLILRQTTIAGGARLAESAYRVLPWAGRTAFPFPAFPTPSPTSRARGTAPLSTAASCTGRVVHRTDDPYTTRGSTGEIRPRAHPCVWAPIPTSTAADAGQTSGPECDGGGGGPAAALSVEQVQQFSIHGFLVVEDVFSEADLAPVHAELAAFHDKADHATRITDKSLLVTEVRSPHTRAHLKHCL